MGNRGDSAKHSEWSWKIRQGKNLSWALKSWNHFCAEKGDKNVSWRSNTRLMCFVVHTGPSQQLSSIPGPENFIVSSLEGAVPGLLPPLSLLMCPYPGDVSSRGIHGCPALQLEVGSRLVPTAAFSSSLGTINVEKEAFFSFLIDLTPHKKSFCLIPNHPSCCEGNNPFVP